MKNPAEWLPIPFSRIVFSIIADIIQEPFADTILLYFLIITKQMKKYHGNSE
jgi:hypothetical protein